MRTRRGSALPAAPADSEERPRTKYFFAFCYTERPTDQIPRYDDESLGDYACFQREADWSEASSEDEYDPAGGLPYCPRYNISRRRSKAMFIQQMRLAALAAEAQLAVKRTKGQRQQARRDMALVVAQIIDVGAIKKAQERAEIGPAPFGHNYLQLG